MSIVASVQSSQAGEEVHLNQDLQKKSSLLQGRVFHTMTSWGKGLMQSVTNIARSVLSKCVYAGLWGCSRLQSLKRYLFSNQTTDNQTASAHLSTRSASLISLNTPPPPPSMPVEKDLNGADSMQRSISSRTGSFDLSSSCTFTQDFLVEDQDDVVEPEDAKSDQKDRKLKESKPVFAGIKEGIRHQFDKMRMQKNKINE